MRGKNFLLQAKDVEAGSGQNGFDNDGRSCLILSKQNEQVHNIGNAKSMKFYNMHNLGLCRRYTGHGQTDMDG